MGLWNSICPKCIKTPNRYVVKKGWWSLMPREEETSSYTCDEVSYQNIPGYAAMRYGIQNNISTKVLIIMEIGEGVSGRNLNNLFS